MSDSVLSIKAVDLVEYYHRMDAPRHPGGVKLLQYWRGIVAERGDFVINRDAPARAIADLLANIVVAEPVSGGGDMKIRLAGANVRRRDGGDLKDHLLSELFSRSDFELHRSNAREILRHGQPVTLDASLRRGPVEELHSEVIALPVKSPDKSKTWLLVGVFYFR